jgi:uncharacterized protein (TIGR02217 family)
MAFHDVRFPEVIGRGARGGPGWRTTVVTLGSGAEERNASWSQARRGFDISSGVRNGDDLAALVAFFNARMGRFHGFRFKDWSDYKSCLPSATVAPEDQALGDGDGVVRSFRLRKRYGADLIGVWRMIRRPVAGTVRVALDGVEALSGWTVNAATGIVSFTVAPGDGVAVTAGFQFDVPVRFDLDQLDLTLTVERLGAIPSIPLVELHEADAALPA